MVCIDKTLLNISALAANIQVRTMEDNALYKISKGLLNICRFVFHLYSERTTLYLSLGDIKQA